MMNKIWRDIWIHYCHPFCDSGTGRNQFWDYTDLVQDPTMNVCE
jgi:hypothetical protein